MNKRYLLAFVMGAGFGWWAAVGGLKGMMQSFGIRPIHLPSMNSLGNLSNINVGLDTIMVIVLVVLTVISVGSKLRSPRR